MEKSNVKVMYCPEHGLQFFDTKTETSEGKYPCEHAPHKENNMEYPEEIYATRAGGLLTSNAGACWGRRHAYKVGHEAGYAEGLAKGLAERPDPLAGYSNLTADISAGEPIDWERLDGRKVWCVNEAEGSLRGVLVRNGRKPDTSDAWWGEEATASYINALYDGWKGNCGWTLWVEGEVPLRRKTADQLEVGTYFQGVSPNREIFTLYVGEMEACGQVSIHYTPTMIKSPHKASEWVVLEEYGTFQKPEGK